MSKGNKPLIFFLIFVFAAITGIFLSYVGVKLECERLTKQKYETEKNLQAKNNDHLNLVAQLQNLSSEERIVNVAENELGMVKRSSIQIVLKVNKDKIEEISNELKEKYEEF